jgi:hypothetical protein
MNTTCRQLVPSSLTIIVVTEPHFQVNRHRRAGSCSFLHPRTPLQPMQTVVFAVKTHGSLVAPARRSAGTMGGHGHQALSALHERASLWMETLGSGPSRPVVATAPTDRPCQPQPMACRRDGLLAAIVITPIRFVTGTLTNRCGAW